MDITQLRYFLKTAELLNYSKAADALFIARQSLRQAISALEEDVGAPLFENRHNKISLTEHGHLLRQSAFGVVASFDKMCSDLQKLSSNNLSLTVAIPGSLFPFVLPGQSEVAAAFSSHFPNITIDVLSMKADDVLEAVKSGKADCGCVMQMPYDRPQLRYRAFQEFDAAIAHNDLFNGKSVIGLEDLLDLPCIGMGSLENSLHPIWEKCRSKGWELRYSIVSSTIDAYYLVMHGKAVGFDLMVTDGQKKDPKHFVRLDGYKFGFGVISTECSEKDALIALFCGVIEREFIKYND